MNVPEAARQLQRSQNTVLRMIDDGRLPGSPRGPKYGHRLVLRAAVEAMAARDQEYSAMSARLLTYPASIWSSRLGPALLILDHPAIRAEVEPHVHMLAQRIDFPAILEQCDAEADVALVEAAQAMYDGSADIGLGRLLAVLNGERLVRVALAIELSQGTIDRWQAFRILARARRS